MLDHELIAAIQRGWLGAAAYAANPVNFDGTNDFLTRGGDWTGNADSKLWTGSLWFRRTGGEGSLQRVGESQNTRTALSFNVANEFAVFARNAAATTILQINTSAVTGTAWHHVMWSVDLANVANRHLYLDGVSNLSVATYTNDTIDFTDTSHAIGGSVAGATKLVAGLADLQIWHGKFIDLSQAANRELFISGGAPVDPDIAAASALGAPIVRLSGPTDTWHTNDGTGGGCTEHGALTDGTGPVGL